MITIRPTRLHWIKDDGKDDPCDLCAHSPILMELDGESLVTPEVGDATVSASALYLLRTLERDHTKADPVGGQLFPCCGNSMYDTGEDDVLICGCPSGSDVFVKHANDGKTELQLPNNGRTFAVSQADWRRAVIEFSDAVQAFYDASLPKTPGGPTDKEGFQKMLAEWKRRRKAADVG